MNVFSWLTARYSNRGKALSLYRRGMVKSKKHDHEGAIDDYSKTIGMHDAPSDVKAMALYNRALVYAAAGRGSQAASDLNTVLGMAGALPNVKSEARRKLARMQHKSPQPADRKSGGIPIPTIEIVDAAPLRREF